MCAFLVSLEAWPQRPCLLLADIELLGGRDSGRRVGSERVIKILLSYAL